MSKQDVKAMLIGTLLGLALSQLSGCGQTELTTVKGDKGDTGAQGIPGQPGVDATPVTVVQLCPGTPTYPTTFPEIALCLGGRLYGTYSANGGFSTELTPGAYASNAVGNSCTFTVLPNCVVQND